MARVFGTHRSVLIGQFSNSQIVSSIFLGPPIPAGAHGLRFSYRCLDLVNKILILNHSNILRPQGQGLHTYMSTWTPAAS